MQEKVSAANMPEEEQEGQSGQLEDARQEVRLETTAQWVDPAAYRGEITLEATGIQRYTRNQMPVQVIPVLDMTDSMNSCESEGHVFPLRAHAISVIPDYQKLWEQLKPQLPTWEEYTRMGQENPENLFLQLPEEVDPTGKARLFCCQRNGSDGYGQHALAGWKIIYVTDDQTPLWDISMEDYSWFYHCIRKGGIYQPIGEMEVKEQRTVWKKDDKKRAEYGCVCSRMDTVKEAYSQFVQSVF